LVWEEIEVAGEFLSVRWKGRLLQFMQVSSLNGP
jgi:hypothetical protein